MVEEWGDDELLCFLSCDDKCIISLKSIGHSNRKLLQLNSLCHILIYVS
jgi:hypothetical protein